MNISSCNAVVATFALAAAIFASSSARADGGAVTCADGRFGDHVESGHAVGDAASIFAARKAVYSVDIANTGEATTVTLVWTVDGKEVQRQSLDVGRAPHWHTWGMRPLAGGQKVDVEVLDAAGASLKKDSIAAGS
jgi:hypothetical protein